MSRHTQQQLQPGNASARRDMSVTSGTGMRTLSNQALLQLVRSSATFREYLEDPAQMPVRAAPSESTPEKDKEEAIALKESVAWLILEQLISANEKLMDICFAPKVKVADAKQIQAEYDAARAYLRVNLQDLKMVGAFWEKVYNSDTVNEHMRPLCGLK